MIKTYWILFLLFFFNFSLNLNAQEPINWIQIRDLKSGVRFSMPENRQQLDTLSTRMYASSLSSDEAVQVHIFENAEFDLSAPVLSTALIQEGGDTLRAIARLIALTSNCDIQTIEEVYDNGNRGMEIEISYSTFQSEMPYSSILRYFIIDSNFVAFTWTGASTPQLAPGEGQDPLNSTIFFNSIRTK